MKVLAPDTGLDFGFEVWPGKEIWALDESLEHRCRSEPWMEVWVLGWRSGPGMEFCVLEGGLGSGMDILGPRRSGL